MLDHENAKEVKKTVKKVGRTAPVRQIKQVFRTFQEFTRLEAAGGLVLMVSALIALLWANSPWAEAYFDLWHTELAIELGPISLAHDLHWWINEGLMVIFFFVVGLEIKREILVGELSSMRQAALPVAAAVGGMVLPAMIYLAINAGTSGERGWGVPMATDIAFALGVMALAGSRLPVGLKVFLTALAIVDDIGAVLVIALFYTSEVVWLNLAISGVILLILVGANLAGLRSPLAFAMLGIALWLAFLGTGLHVTLAGILLALTIPASAKIRTNEFITRAHTTLHEFERHDDPEQGLLTGGQQGALQALEDAAQEISTPLQRLEHALHPWVTFGIIPLFALANAGVSLQGDVLSILFSRVSLGVMAGLIVGKQIGISLASWLAVKLGWASLPERVSWRQIYGVGWLAGIGFTMSLFITELALTDPENIAAAKVGILGASILAGVVGYFLLSSTVKKEEA